MSAGACSSPPTRLGFAGGGGGGGGASLIMPPRTPPEHAAWNPSFDTAHYPALVAQVEAVFRLDPDRDLGGHRKCRPGGRNRLRRLDGFRGFGRGRRWWRRWRRWGRRRNERHHRWHFGSLSLTENSTTHATLPMHRNVRRDRQHRGRCMRIAEGPLDRSRCEIEHGGL